MKKDQIHQVRKNINILRNTFNQIVTVEAHEVINYDQVQKVKKPHPLVSEAMVSLRRAREWSGKLLAFQGAEAPTEEKYAKEGPDDATTDSLPVTNDDTKNLSLLRAEITKVIDIVDGPNAPEYKPTKNQARAVTNIFNHLTEARFTIGELIGELRVQGAKQVDEIIEDADKKENQ